MKTKFNMCHGGRAFTLIEILIVVSIILIIAALGIGSYGSARKNLELDLQTDNLVAILHSLRDETQNGARGGGQVQCYGVKFQKNAVPQKIQAAYKNQVDGCASEAEEQHSRLDLSTDIWSSEITLDGNGRDAASVIFVPPYGTMQLRPAGAGTKLEITLSPKNDSLSKRIIEINSDAGKVGKKS